MNKFICTLALGLMASASAFAQIANVKAAEKILKSDKPDITEARRLITEALSNEESKNNPYTWYVSGLIDNKLYNEAFKATALDQAADKTELYKSLSSSLPAWFKVYEIESQPNEKGKIKLNYAKKVKETLTNDYPQLLNGGIYFIQGGKYADAAQLFDDYLSVRQSPIFADVKEIATVDSAMMNAAYYAMGAALEAKAYDKVIALHNKYGKISTNPKEAIQWVVSSYLAKGDSAKAIPVMREALTLDPNSSYLLGNLLMTYKALGQEKEADALLDERLSANPNDVIALMVKGQNLESSGKLKDALLLYYRATQHADKNAGPFMLLGQGLYNGAALINEKMDLSAADQANISKLLEYAIPFLEVAYKTNPDDVRGVLGSAYYQLKMTDKRSALDEGKLEIGEVALPNIPDLIANISLEKKEAPKATVSEQAQPVQQKATKKSTARRRK